MKLNVKAFGIVAGVMWAVWVFWCVLMQIVGIGSATYEFVDTMYLGWLEPTIGGLILGVVIGLVDGFVFGAVFAWLYNKIAK